MISNELDHIAKRLDEKQIMVENHNGDVGEPENQHGEMNDD